ncbi:MAG: hypothetical protein AAGI03_00655 [Pseudomonadota bacterium]
MSNSDRRVGLTYGLFFGAICAFIAYTQGQRDGREGAKEYIEFKKAESATDQRRHQEFLDVISDQPSAWQCLDILAQALGPDATHLPESARPRPPICRISDNSDPLGILGDPKD